MCKNRVSLSKPQLDGLLDALRRNKLGKNSGIKQDDKLGTSCFWAITLYWLGKIARYENLKVN